jgi:hypothetical protein
MHYVVLASAAFEKPEVVMFGFGRKKESPVSIKLGDKVRDKISGLTGIAVCKTEWLYGCVRFGVQSPEIKDGRPVDSHYFDEPQLELVQDNEAKPADTGGGPARETDAGHAVDKRSWRSQVDPSGSATLRA